MKDIGRYIRRGVNMGIGTDTYPHNMLDEMRLAAHIARTQAGDPRTMTTTDLFNAATIGGAKALGRDDIGRLAVGCRADFSLVDITHPMIRPAYDPVRSLIYAAGDRALKAVFVDGNKVVEDGEVLTMDYRQAAAAPARGAEAHRRARPAAGLGASQRREDRAADLPLVVTRGARREGRRPSRTLPARGRRASGHHHRAIRQGIGFQRPLGLWWGGLEGQGPSNSG